MKTLNWIFSSLFLLWYIAVVFLPDINAKKSFHYGFGVNGMNYFWEFIIFATFFNILARVFNQCNFYLVGAFGFLTLSLTQFFCFLFFIKNLINGYSDRRSRDADLGQCAFIILTSPYIIFGILSSLCCYQTKIRQRINRTQSKLQKYFLQIPFTNNQKIISIFNFMVAFSAVIFVFILFIHLKEKFVALICLFPIIPTSFYFMAIKFQKKLLYRLTIFCYGFFTAIFIAFYIYSVIYAFTEKEHMICDLIGILTVVLIFLIPSVIGFFSTLSLLHEIQKRENDILETNFENLNFVALQKLDGLNHYIEDPRENEYSLA